MEPGNLTSSTAAHAPLTDAHAHIVSAEFDPDRDAVLERALKCGVQAIVAVGETLADAEKNLELAQRYEVLRPMAGLYPTYLDEGQAEELIGLIRRERDRLIGIGEVGSRSLEGEGRGRADPAARDLLCSSSTCRLNLICRLTSTPAPRVGRLWKRYLSVERNESCSMPLTAAPRRRCREWKPGTFFSVPPSIVRSRQKQKLVKQLPLDCLLLETDSPVLGPEPRERNLPENVLISLQEIARIKEMEVAAVTGRGP